MLMPFMEELADEAGLCAACGAATFIVEVLPFAFFARPFFAAAFFFACFAGIGIDMPRMFICAIAGVVSVASTSALAATNNFDFTSKFSKGEAPP